MTKQDFVNFIDGRTINFDAMYHGGWTDKTPDIWITPGTYPIAYMRINSGGTLWNVGISSNIITYGDDSSNILTDTIPNDVFTAATNALAPYLITTYTASKSAPISYKAPEPTPTPYIALHQHNKRQNKISWISLAEEFQIIRHCLKDIQHHPNQIYVKVHYHLVRTYMYILAMEIYGVYQ